MSNEETRARPVAHIVRLLLGIAMTIEGDATWV